VHQASVYQRTHIALRLGKGDWMLHQVDPVSTVAVLLSRIAGTQKKI
jgi:hypothetical protein